jgi:flagellin-like protein
MKANKKRIKQNLFNYNFLKNDKKGLSGIITTLILISIALIAVGVVWYTLNKIMSDQKENAETSSENVFKTCSEAGYFKMEEDSICEGGIRYIGGEECCTIPFSE